MPTRISKLKKEKAAADKINAISRADALELLVDYGINLQTRELELTGDVDDVLYKRLSRGLGVLNQLNPPKLTVVLNTGGGDLFSALGMYDLIRFNKVPVDIKAIGTCMSAGTIILQAGTKRLSTPSASFMVHYGHESIAETFKNVKRYMTHREDLEKMVADIFMERCSWTAGYYDELHDKDTYLTADKALGINLIDRIVTC